MDPKKNYLLATFLATSLAVSGCSRDEATRDIIVDDQDRTVRLLHNPDGTMTALYEDGETVTFRRNKDNTLSPVSGSTWLISGLAAGYFLSRGIQTNGFERTSTGAYRPVDPVPLGAYSYSGGGEMGGGRSSSPARGFGSVGARSAVS